MKISKIKIQNFKSFRDSPWIELGSRRTVVVGQNNSGKTALLQALRFGENASSPYRGPLNVPLSVGSPSRFLANIIVDGRTIEEFLKETTQQVYVPFPDNESPQNFLERIWASPALEFLIEATPGNSLSPRRYPSYDMFPERAEDRAQLIQYDRQKSSFQLFGNISGENLPTVIEGMRQRFIYVFDPERLKIGSCAASETSQLDPSARNLPAVLATMSRNPAKWSVFNQHVRDVFPSVKAVAVSTLKSEIAVYIWQNDPDESPDDYAILLQDSGTGLAQVISILYVAMTRIGNVIAIDEPNSFLHPGAAKKLMNILKYYDGNQYIISTHSPELINIIEPENLISVSWKDGESHIENLDRNSIEDLEYILVDLGCELADVFSADRVVWCEGPTEAKVFPIIARAAGINISTTAFLRLRATGDLESQKIDAQAVMDIYGILGRGSSLLPRSTTFNLDREGRSPTEIADIVRQSRGRAKFLPARTLENYLVDPDAIAAVLESDYKRTQTSEASPTSDEVREWLQNNIGSYVPEGGDVRHEDLDAPKLLSRMFQDLTGNLHIYRKTHHSVELARWLVSHKPRDLSDLTEYVRILATEENENDPAE